MTYTKNLTAEVLEVLKAGKLENNIFYLPSTPLERKLYLQVNEVLENSGGKWNRKIKGHIFENDPTEKLGLALETGMTVNEKQLFQFFETPPEIVDRLLELAEIEYSNDPMKMQDVLEPSAGHGAIADKIDGSRCMFRCGEIDPQKVKVLIDKGYAVFEGDFLTNKDEEFDRIIMNPPFAKQQDIDHVNHAYNLLRSGGRVVSVMSPGFTFRSNKKSAALRELVEANGFWEECAPESFKESGTNIRTVIVVLNKP